MIFTVILGSLAVLSVTLLLWQWLAARRFPLHRRNPAPAALPPVTLLKPIKGCDAETGRCLRSWFTQDYAGATQILFGVASAADPACAVVSELMREFPQRDAQLVVCGELIGANAKVSKLSEMEKLAKHDVLVISDADVRAPEDFLRNMVTALNENGPNQTTLPAVGLVNCFYRLANPGTLAMQWEAIAINADFWSQVLQSQTLKPLDFALGAVMATRRRHLQEIGGFQTLADCLADDYQLGHRIARRGHRVTLCPVVVECWDPPMTWRAVWKHQLRWARTIRVCQPAPYFFSILSNAGFWAAAWLAWELLAMRPGGSPMGAVLATICGIIRVLVACDLQARLTKSLAHVKYCWLVPVKDFLQAAIWLCAFAGNKIEWRGQQFTLRRDGTLVRNRSSKALPA